MTYLVFIDKSNEDLTLALMLQTLALIEKITHGSGLAPLLKLEGIGKRTIQKLTFAGYVHPKDLQSSTQDDLINIGVTIKQTKKILTLVQRPRR